MIIVRVDPFTSKENKRDINVTKEQLEKWKAGGIIQDVMGNLTASEREFIMTGITDISWEKLNSR